MGDLASAGNLVEHMLISNFAAIGCLDLRPDPHKGTSYGIFGRGEQHLVLNLGAIGRPADEEDLIPLATLLFVSKVVNSPPTLGLWESTDEIIVITVCARILNDDLGVVVVEAIDDVLVLVTKLEILESGETGRVDCYARCHG